VVTFNVEIALPFAAGVTDAGVREQLIVAETGTMAQVNATAELKLFTEVTVMVEAVVFPAVVVAEAGAAARVKSGAAPTFKV
jgi:hypothetical protein